MAKIRAFLAVNLGVPTIRAVGDCARELRRTVPRELRVAWVPPANMHLTVKFLGPIEPEAAEAVGDRLGRGLVETRPIEVRVAGLGAFPDATRPRVLWAGVEDPGGGLSRLVASVEGWLEELGFPREARPFSPHLTLGRVKEGSASVETALAPALTKQFGASVLREIVLYESRLRAAGAEYVALRRVPFGVRAPERSSERGAGPAPAAGEGPARELDPAAAPGNPNDTERTGNGG
jgi:2'-5' RNA ligase